MCVAFLAVQFELILSFLMIYYYMLYEIKLRWNAEIILFFIVIILIFLYIHKCVPTTYIK